MGLCIPLFFSFFPKVSRSSGLHYEGEAQLLNTVSRPHVDAHDEGVCGLGGVQTCSSHYLPALFEARLVGLCINDHTYWLQMTSDQSEALDERTGQTNPGTVSGI